MQLLEVSRIQESEMHKKGICLLLFFYDCSSNLFFYQYKKLLLLLIVAAVTRFMQLVFQLKVEAHLLWKN